MERILQEQGATGPNFGGVTADGVKIAFSADAVRPDADDRRRWIGTSLSASFDLPSGTVVSLESPQGIVDATGRLAILQGGAVLTSTTGYRVTTDQIVASFDETTIVAEQGIVAEGPPGTITAGRMVLNRVDGEPPNHHLVFQDRVRLVYQPGN